MTQTDFIICPMLLTHWADNKQVGPISYLLVSRYTARRL